MTILLAAAILLAQDAKGRVAQAEQGLSRQVLDDRLELGDWCKAQALYAEARLHYRFVKKLTAVGTPWRSKAEKGLTGSWAQKPDATDARVLDDYRKRLDRYAREAADRAFLCYKIARDGKLANAEALLLRTIEYDGDHPDARKERREVRVPAFGWVPESEVGAWKEPATSKHFVLRSSRPDAAATLDHLERVYDAFFKIFEGRFKEPAGPVAVCWADPGEIERIRARLPGAPTAGTMDFYNQLTQVCYASSGLPTLTHEITHALADLSAGPGKCILLAAGRRADAGDNYWVAEGLACYFATIRFRGDAPEFPGPLPPEDFKLDEFVKLDSEEFHRNLDRNYALGEMLVRRFMQGPKRARFLDFVRDFYAGRDEFPKELR